MLAPEVWKFSPPPSSFSSDFVDNNTTCHYAESQYFNHQISLTMPNSMSVPDDLVDSVCVDTDFYHISNVPLAVLAGDEFYKYFISTGKVTALSSGTRIDEDDCLALTPSGKLILSLKKETYQKLGIDGKPTRFSKKNPDRYLIKLFLDSTKSEKQKLGRLKSMESCFDLCFDVIISWEPTDTRLCPSSLAAFFCNMNYLVKTCKNCFNRNIQYDVLVPNFSEDCDPLELTEWLGAHHLQFQLPEVSEGSMSSFAAPSDSTRFGQVCTFQGTGFFTTKQVTKLIKKVEEYVSQYSTTSWVALHVQGFEDSAVNVDGNEHHFYTSGDYGYTMFFQNNVKPLVCKFISSSRAPTPAFKKRKRRR